MAARDLFSHEFAIAIAILAVAVPVLAAARDCTPNDSSAQLQPTDGIYGQALALSKELASGGFVTRCVLRSHMEGLFEDMLGAALFRTDRGDFEALFLAPPKTFDLLIVSERREGNHWVYSFEGRPRPWAANRMEGRRTLFVKNGHRLLMVLENEPLAATLRRVLAPPARR